MIDIDKVKEQAKIELEAEAFTIEVEKEKQRLRDLQNQSIWYKLFPWEIKFKRRTNEKY